MGFRPHGRAKVSTTNPRAFARCDRCGFIYNHCDLRFQYDYRGPMLANLRILVCETCLDKPQPQLKPVLLTADPLPIINARPEDYLYANTQGLATSPAQETYQQTGIPIPNNQILLTEDGTLITTEPIGTPIGLDPNAVMPLHLDKHFNVVIPLVSLTTDGTGTVFATTSGAHNLNTDDQVTVMDLTDNRAAGFYSVIVTTATAFKYQILTTIPANSLLTSNTRVATAKVGLPPGYAQIPVVGSPNG